jgi:hypothetical protein
MGKNVGGYDKEEKAARAYDLAALKYWGPTTTTNFPVRAQEVYLDSITFRGGFRPRAGRAAARVQHSLPRVILYMMICI